MKNKGIYRGLNKVYEALKDTASSLMDIEEGERNRFELQKELSDCGQTIFDDEFDKF